MNARSASVILLHGMLRSAVSMAPLASDLRDFIVVDSSHTLLMFSREVRYQVRRFLAEGRFDHRRNHGSTLGQ